MSFMTRNLSKTCRRRRHSVSLLHAHLVFVTKYRRRVITTRVFERLRRSMTQTARALGVTLVAIEADGDHPHLMIEHQPCLTLSEIVRRLKGASSRFIRQARLPEVLRRLWGRAFWSPSFFVVSCGGAPLETVKAYVENQGQSPQKPSCQQDPSRTYSSMSNSKRKPATPYPRTEVRGLRALHL